MRILLDSFFYSVLYYNSVVWLTPLVSAEMKQCLLSVSANALRSCLLQRSSEISFVKIHEICKKCTPAQIMSYQNSLFLHRFINEIFVHCTTEHVRVLNNVVCTSRQLNFEITRSNNVKIGMNTISNKLYHITKLVSLNNLNLSFVHFKKLMKFQFLKYGKT